MSKTSEVEKLLAQNPKLQELRQPFDEYYAYYKLRKNLEIELEKFLSSEQTYINSMQLTIYLDDENEVLPISSPYKLSDFLPHLASKKGNACKLTCQVFNSILQAPESKGDRNKIRSSQLKNDEERWKKSGLGKYTKKKVGASMISAFSARADLCEEKSKKDDHSDIKFLNFISIFCGYKDFKNFLNIRFGPNYQIEEDVDLQRLIQNYPGEIEPVLQNKQSSKFETTTQLVSKSIHKPEILIGREEDLEAISDILNSKGRVAVIGEGGMGKTSVAAALYHRALERRSYSDIAWLFCEHGTISALFETALGLGITLEGPNPDDRLPSITHALQQKGKNLLLVLDNVENDLDDFFQKFQGFDGHVLITSRSSFGWEGLEEHRLPALSTEDAKTLFITHYSGKKGPLESGAKFEELLDQLTSAIGYNTLLIELFAKLLKQDFSDTAGSEYGIRQFLDKLKEVGLSFADGEVKTNYSFHRRQKVATIPEILDILYDFSKLDEVTRHLLVNLSLLPAQEFSDQELLEIFDPKDLLQFRRTLSKLHSQGWIGGDGRKTVRVSPVVQEMTVRKNKESLREDSKILQKRIVDYFKESNNDSFITNLKLHSLAIRIDSFLQSDLALTFIQISFTKPVPFYRINNWQRLEQAKKEFNAALDSDMTNFKKNFGLINQCRSCLQNIDGKDNLMPAEKKLRKILYSNLNSFGKDSLSVAVSRSYLALVLEQLGGVAQLENALEEFDRASGYYLKNFGHKSRSRAICGSKILEIQKILKGQENLFEEIGELRRFLDSHLKRFGANSSSTYYRVRIAKALIELGGEKNLIDAEIELRIALKSNLENFGRDSPTVAICRSNLACTLTYLGGRERNDEAKKELIMALKCYLKNFGNKSYSVNTCRSNLVDLLLNLKGRENLLLAKTELELDLEFHHKNSSDVSRKTIDYSVKLAEELIQLSGKGNLLEAVDLLAKIHPIASQHFPKGHPNINAIDWLINKVKKRLEISNLNP